MKLYCLFIMFACALIGKAHALNYSQFTPIANTPDGNSLQQAIDQGISYIALGKPETYLVNNPVRISGTQVYIHGLDREKTKLKLINPDAPLFVVDSIKNKLSFSNFKIDYPVGKVNWEPIHFRNSNPILFESLDMDLGGSQFTVNGPGTFRFQGTLFRTNANMQVSAALVVAHRDADVTVVGGDASSTLCATCGELSEFHHFWQKHGRLRIFNMAMQNNPGPWGDVRFETSSNLGHHVLAYVRSEGSQYPHPSKILYVSAGMTRPVNVIMAANALTVASPAHPENTLADFSGPGQLYMFANISSYGAFKILKGNPMMGSTVLIGNYIGSGNAKPIDVKAWNVPELNDGSGQFYQTNLFYGSNKIVTTTTSPQSATNITYGGLRENISSVYPNEHVLAPSLVVPDALVRPTMDIPFPDVGPSHMVNIANAPYYVNGFDNDTIDDSVGIQNALNDHRYVFFPAGTYHLHSALNIKSIPSHGYGGMMAGPSRDMTILKRRHSDNGSVIASFSNGYFTIQGLTFNTAPYNSITNQPQVANVVFARGTYPLNPQEIMVHDCTFDGGYDAVAMSPYSSDSMGSESMFSNSTFKNARFGFMSGLANAYNNLIYNSTIDNVGVVAGGHPYQNMQGQFGIFNSTATNVSEEMFSYFEGTDAVTAAINFTGTAPRIFGRGYSSAIRYGIYYDNSNFYTPTNGRMIHSETGYSVVANRSSFSGHVWFNWPLSASFYSFCNEHSYIMNSYPVPNTYSTNATVFVNGCYSP